MSITVAEMKSNLAAVLRKAAAAEETENAEAVRHLPLHHHDPFDGVMIAQAQIEDMAIVTADLHFAGYDLRLA